MKPNNINVKAMKEHDETRLVPAAGLLTTATCNKDGTALGLLLGLFLCAASTATAQPTVTSHPIAIDEITGVVTLTVNYSEDMDYTTATDPNNYVLVDSPTGKATLTSATMPSTASVSFEVTGLYGGDDYTLNISGVKDVAQANTVTTNLTGTVPGLRLAILEGIGTATQKDAGYGAPGLARDGDISTFNHTLNADNEWWELDLGSAQGPIGGLAIYFRQDCCYDRNHDLLFTIMDANRAPLWTAYIHQAPPKTTSPYMTNFFVGAPVMGRYVRIEHPTGVANQDFIHFGEVRLLGPSTGLVIAGQPASLTVPQNKPASFIVGVEGTAPITYLWKHEGTNVPGGTNATLSIVSAKPADVGSYVVVVTDATGRQRTSVPATLSVVIDTVPPTVTGHSWSQDTFQNKVTLTVKFSEALNPLTATNPANYKFLGTSAVLGSGVTDGSNVTFVVSGPLSDNYILNVSGVQDLADNILVATNLTGTVPPMPYAYLGGTATQSTDPWGDHPWQARDGNIFTRAGTGGGPGGPGGGSTDEWWELDLGSPVNIGALVLWFRNDGSQQRDHDYVITIMDAARTAQWTGYIGSPLPSVDPRMTNMVVSPAVQGEFVRIEHPPGMAEFVTTTEVQVLSPPTHSVGGQNLEIGGSGSGLNLNWPISGYIVQTNANLANPSGWHDMPGANISPLLINAKSGSSLFYRLRKQAAWETAYSVAFEAESTTNLVAGTPENWIVASDALGSGGSALMVDGSTSTSDSPQSFAQYQIKFKTAGTYHIYYRWRANNPASSGDANSFWLATGFGAFSTPGDQTPFVVSASNGYSTPGDTTYQWLLDTPNYVVGAAEIASPPTLTFGTREAGMTIDRVVLSTSLSLTAADLDSLPNTQ
ncbi:MAG: hypothetical protein NT154_11605 [Verrucomicrobia bacterium]|nr:hypothetical protein [Verrucomicrobiota bacterium]